MAILKLNQFNESREIDFELDYLLSLTTHQRFQMMFAKTQEMLSLLRRNENRKTPHIIKRTGGFSSLNDLIRMKRAAKRPKDLEDLKYLQRLKKKRSKSSR